jgi:signal transduction histidine kinase
VEQNRLINQELPSAYSVHKRTAVLRTLWLLITIGVVILLAASVFPRLQMLRDDIYGFAEGLEGLGLSLNFFAAYFVTWELLVAGVSLLVAALIAWKRGDDWFAMLVAVSLTLFGLLPPLIEGLAYVLPQWMLPVGILRVLVLSTLMAVICLFPNGRFAPPWTRWLLLLWSVVALVILFVDPLVIADTAVLPNTRTLEDARWVLVGVTWFLAAISGQVIRYRRYATPVEKQQMKWVLFGFSLTILFSLVTSLMLISFPGLTSSPDNEVGMVVILGGFYLLTALVIPFAIALSILRYRLWDVDILLNRTLVYGGLTLLITIVYVLLVGSLGALAATQSNQILGLILATVIVMTLLSSPLRTRWQSAVDRYVPAVSEPSPVEGEQPGEGLRGVNRPLAWFSLVLAILLTAANMGFTINFSGLRPALIYLTGPAFVAVGTLIILQHPENRIGRLCLLSGWLFVLINLGLNQNLYTAWEGIDRLRPAIMQISLSMGQVMCILIFVYLLLLFPDGQFPSPGWRRSWRLFATVMAILIVLIFFKRGPIDNWSTGDGAMAIDNPFGVNLPLLADVPTITLLYAWALPTLLAIFAAIGSLFVRWRHSEGQTRQQVKWVVYFLCTFVAVFMIMELILWLFYPGLSETTIYPAFEAFYDALGIFAWAGFPLVIGLAIFKYRLYDIDIVVNRTLVYGGLSLAVIAVYVVTVGTLGTLFQSQGNFLFALIATGLIALLFQPLRSRLQQGVNRLMFGERDDPYKVLAQVGHQLQTTETPQATLQSLVETIAATLKLPYVAIELAGGERRLSGATTGTAAAETAELPLRYQNETIGYLVASPRAPGESFTERERRLLADIAGQAGAVAYSMRLMAALQYSREKLVLTREEERRRIRRDLHDELGPTLASQTFALDTAIDALETDPQQTRRLLQALKSQNQETVAAIRQLVYELRPPALDELGLVGALGAQAGRLNKRDILQIHITSQPDPLPTLSAAVEVAAYRIALEAMNNVARHAQARSCDVLLRIEENGRRRIRIEIIDDGSGLPEAFTVGVGLHSMRERADELGGNFDARSLPDGGTRVTAVLPL